MQKYKVVASKSQKKYSLIISADSEIQAKEKLHTDGYSVLTIHPLIKNDIEWKKFLFQVQKDAEIKNGIIVWDDIFKVYIKLVDELWYNVISLYPEWDDAHNDAEKKQKIIEKLQQWYQIQKRKIKNKEEIVAKEESFYLKKRIEETNSLIEKAASKIDYLFNNKASFEIDDDTFFKLEKVYEKLLHIKGSTNIVKLQEVWELALMKLAEIELKSVEKKKDSSSRKLLSETNTLLKKLGSDKHYVEEDRDYKKKITSFFQGIKKILTEKKESPHVAKKWKQEKKIDTESYNFLKTVLLLEKYKEKLQNNTKEIQKNIFIFLNPFSKNENKEKLKLKRLVIKQNISILKAKKNGSISSYTSVKKGFKKIIDVFIYILHYSAENIFIWLLIFSFSFLFIISFWSNYPYIPKFWGEYMLYLPLLCITYYIFYITRWFLSFGVNLVFLSLIYIFSIVNF